MHFPIDILFQVGFVEGIENWSLGRGPHSLSRGCHVANGFIHLAILHMFGS